MPSERTSETRLPKARGAVSNPQGRFERDAREAFDDGWMRDDEPAPEIETTVTEERARSIIARNKSPDIPFDQSINPYRGCEHGCNYCYARPSHAHLELSPGLDFETKLFAKTNAAELLTTELAKPGYEVTPIMLGANTDCYQPVERKWKLTRQLLEILAECQHPVTIVTKSALIERDLDLLAPMAMKSLVEVHVSIATLDRVVARRLEPRAASPQRRLDTIRALSSAGIPTGVLVAPIIPALTDATIEAVVEAAHAAGARSADYTLLRLPNELKGMFREWLATHYPQRADHVMSIVRDMRGGRDNDPNFHSRMSGKGNFAELIRARFALARKRYGMELRLRERIDLDCTRFRAPLLGGQMSLF